jgi:hypothetical protein
MSINRTRLRPWLLILLIMFPVLVVNLSFNILSFNSQGLGATQNVNTTAQSASRTSPSLVNIQIGNTGTSNLTYYYLATAVFAFACGVIYLKLRSRRKTPDKYFFVFETPPTGSSFPLVIALCLIILLFFGALELVRYLTLPVLSGSHSPASLDATQYFTLIALASIVGVSAYCLFTLYRSEKFLASTSSQTIRARPEKKAEEFKAALDQAVYSLDLGSDYRSTIIQTYKALCSIIEESGIPQDASLTPREFEISARQRLGVVSNYLHEATMLFERARYSNEELTQEDTLKAKECFRGLSSEIEHGRLKTTVTS